MYFGAAYLFGILVSIVFFVKVVDDYTSESNKTDVPLVAVALAIFWPIILVFEVFKIVGKVLVWFANLFVKN